MPADYEDDDKTHNTATSAPKPDRAIRKPEVLERFFPGSNASLQREEGKGNTPKRFHPWEGSNAVAWWESEWLERQARQKAERNTVEDVRPRDRGRFSAAAAE